jgi:hypothetical protein
MLNKKRNKPKAPVDPLPNPNLGDANMPSPIDQAEHASFAPYQSNLGLAEPQGELDASGVRKEAEPQPPPDR